MNTDARCAVALLAAAVWLPICSSAAKPTSDVKVWPIFYRASDPVTSRIRTEVFWPLYVRESTSQYTANQILSFPQRYPKQYPKQLYLLWPLSGVRAGHGHDAWLFPLLWSSAEAEGRRFRHALFPALYYGRWGSRRTLNILLLQHNSWRKSSRFHALWPFLWMSADNPRGRVSCGALPLFWLARDKTDKPDHRSRSNSGGVLLLNWWHRSEHESTSKDGTTHKRSSANDGLFPVIYRANSSDAETSAKESRTHHADACWVIPYWQSHEKTVTTRPGTAAETTAKSRHNLFPLWWDWRSEEGGRIDSGCLLFPFWWRSAERRDGELVKTASSLVPVGAYLYKKDEYETQNLLGPVFNRTENKREHYVRYDAFFPMLSMTKGRDRSGGRVFPFTGWGSRRGRYSNLWYLFPLGWRCESQEAGEYRVDSPRFWALHELESQALANPAHPRRAGPRRTVAFYPFFWSKRRADEQSFGALPLWGLDTYRSGRNVYAHTVLPLLLGRHATGTRDGKPTYTRRDYLFSILAWGQGEDYRLRRVFPLFSYESRRGRRDISSLVLPFSYDTRQDPDRPGRYSESRFSIPFDSLPWCGSRNWKRGADRETRESWCFPFWKRTLERSPQHHVRKLSVLWPVWNAEWENEETRVRGFGGTVNFYEKDANGFVEQRILHRLVTRRTRSWFSEHELMPFYARQSREDGDSYWKLLGGLLGAETRGGRSYLRVLYLPIPTGKARRPDAAALKARQAEHAELALRYLRHHRHDRAAIEFTLTGSARADDRDFQIAAAEAYLEARAEAVGRELRSSIPSSLEPLAGKTGYFDARAVHKNLRELAIRYFERAIALGADRPALLRKIARAYRDMGQHETALEKLTESDELRPSFAVGMARLEVLAHLGASGWPIGPRSAGQGRWEEYREQWRRLLAELQGRYSDSPTLALREAEALGDREEREVYQHGFGGLTQKGAFSPLISQKLALYERGAQMQPGPEERTWLAEKPPRRPCAAYGYLGSLTYWARMAGRQVDPRRGSAAHAIVILSRQASFLMDDEKTDEAEARLSRIRKLLPRVCDTCTEAGRTCDPFGCISAAMGELYRLHVKVKGEPEAYIAAAREWAVVLCARHKKVIERSLEAVLFEQQYLKRWRLSPVTGCSFEAKAYRGKFFDRYVDLDATLGRLDNCTVAAKCVLVSPDERRAVLRVGFDHTLKVELNGETILREHSRKIAVRDELTLPITLRQGKNRLKLTITDDTLGYGFFVRLSDGSGGLMEDVSYYIAAHN